MGLFIKKYLWLITLIWLAICAYFSAKIVSLFIAESLVQDRKLTPSKGGLPSVVVSNNKPPAPREQYRVIQERNIFDSKYEAPETCTGAGCPGAETQVAQTQPTQLDLNAKPVKTSLAIKLKSTFSVDDGKDERSSATIQGTGSSGITVYKVNDSKEFSPNTKIIRILADRVEFINGNRLEYVEIESLLTSVPSNSSSPTTPDRNPIAPKENKEDTPKEGVKVEKITVSRAELDEALNPTNLFATIGQIKSAPYYANNRMAGLRLLSVPPGGLFSKLSLQGGDILEKLNGQTVDPFKTTDLLNQLKSLSKINIDLIRGGQKITHEYEIR